VRESKNQLLYQFYLQTSELFLQYSTRSFTLTKSTVVQTLEEHKKILEAIRSSDADGARVAITEHLNIAKDRMDVIKKTMT
jgi:DNA-binding FadR family transcriptional regulator